MVKIKVKRRKTHNAVVMVAFVLSISLSTWLIMLPGVPFGVPFLAGWGTFEVVMQVGSWLRLTWGKREWTG